MNAIKAKFLTRRVIGFQRFDFEQHYQIYSGFRKYDLTKEQVKIYAKKSMSSHRMSFCKHTLAEGFPLEEMEEWLNMDLDGYMFRHAIKCRMRGIPKERVLQFVKLGGTRQEEFKRYVELLDEYR